MRPSPLLVTAAAAAVAMGTACSAEPGDGDTPTSTRPAASASATPRDQDGTRRVELAPADAPAVVLPAAAAASAAIEASAALFAASPAVVLVDPADTADTAATAATAATDLGVPLLLATGPQATDGPLAAELGRLGTTDVLVVGTGAAAAAATLDVEVATEAGDLPGLADVDPVPGTTVLTTGAPTDAAALSTADAAGAAVVTVAGGDPRADPAAIEALAAAPPTRVVALGAGFGTAEVLAARTATAATGVQLPGGGQLVLDGERYVALYGHPGAPALGLLGEQDLGATVARAQQLARSYRPLSEVPVVPTFEIITTVASAGPGTDGDHSSETDREELLPWVEEAERQGVYVLLDLQPGSTDFLTQAKRYETLLAHPNVGLALDPEWRLEPGQKHLEQIGSVTAAEVNTVSAWLAELVHEQRLPQKMLVLHQFTASMITDIGTLETGHDELALVVHADGHGTQGAKAATWSRIVAGAPGGVALAWKNFVDEDSPMATPAQTMAVQPTPVLITYQ